MKWNISKWFKNTGFNSAPLQGCALAQSLTSVSVLLEAMVTSSLWAVWGKPRILQREWETEL